MTGAQSEDSSLPGYTYEGLEGDEALKMVLWRPIFEGLAKGAKSRTKSRADGTGNFMQRSCVLTLRTILLRHGSYFSDNELSVALKDTIIPAFQSALENDNSPVVSIASESPSVSSLDFLAEPFPLPPSSDDEGLIKFEQVLQQSEKNPRKIGPAELLLEATFTVMRNGGGGDLTEAYKFLKKDMESKEDDEQPFPDSWISTTAPIAIGALTDISSEILFARGANGAAVWRSTIGATYLRCCNGDITSWVPCEAVVRIATTELSRFMKRVTRNISTITEKENATAWANHLIEFYTEVMGRNLGISKNVLDMIMESKCPELKEKEVEKLVTPPSSPLKTIETEEIANADETPLTPEVVIAKDDTVPSPTPSPVKAEESEPNEEEKEGEEEIKEDQTGEEEEKQEPPTEDEAAEDITNENETSIATEEVEAETPEDVGNDNDNETSMSSEVVIESSDAAPTPPSSPLKTEEGEPSADGEEPQPSEPLEDETEKEPSTPLQVSDDQEDAASASSSSSSSSSSSESSSSSSSRENLTENWVSVENSHDGEDPSEITEHTESKHGSSSGSSSDSESESSENSSKDGEESQVMDDDSAVKEIKLAMAKIDVRTLYPSTIDEGDILPVDVFAKLDERYNTPDSPDWMKLLPALKLRCVAAHYLQKILLSLREEELIGFVSHEAVSNLLKILNASRDFAEDAAKNADLAHAFQEAMLSEWGISEDMGEEALETIARLNHTQGSAMFFLTQTAGATNGVNRLLTALYDHEETFGGEDHWDRRVFAGQYLVAIMEDIFRKFAESEAKEGHKVDPNVWRNSSESGVKVAIYCTSFASVVVGLLRAMLSFEPALIERNKGVFFPLVCELVGVRSEEIRKLVRRVLTEKFGPMLGLGQDTGGRVPMRLSMDGGSAHGE